MSESRVSILLPCLNARPFLQARIDSLLAQTCSNWEAIVLDSHSDDGSWEFFQSIAASDPRFQLHRIPREGLYAALNQGLPLVSGEFLHVATCDDTMHPEFLATMLQSLGRCPEAGIAACDLLLINQNGDELSLADLQKYLSLKAARELLAAGTVRTARGRKTCQLQINYRPSPHDCLLHFTGKSVYYSLTQLVIRADMARKAGPFETNVGSIGDFGWLLGLTNLTGTVHVPEKLATWRFHGDQLSIDSDGARVAAIKSMCDLAMPEIYQRHYPLLSRNDCSILLLPCRRRLARSFSRRLSIWIEAGLRLFWMFVKQPMAMVRTLYSIPKIASIRASLVPIVLERIRCTPRPLTNSHGPAPDL